MKEGCTVMTPQEAIEAITVEAITMDDNVVGVNVHLYGVPVHYVSKTVVVPGEDEHPVGPCEMWLHWGNENGRITRRSLNDSRSVLQG